MSNIIRHAQWLVEGPFALPETTTDLVNQGVGCPAPSNVIRNREVSAYPVRAFMWYEASPGPAHADERDHTALRDVEDHRRPERRAGEQGMSHTAERAKDIYKSQDTLHTPPAEHVLLLHQAQEEAERCLRDAREQAAALAAEAYRAGFKQGEEAAREATREQFALVLASFHHAAEEILQLRAKVLRLAEEDVITLALHIARKIIRQEVLSNREVLTTTLRRALDRLIDRDNIVARVNPEDLQQALDLQEDLLPTTGGIQALTIQADTAIGRGGCVVESAFGEIDARLEAQIEEVEQRFREQYSLVLEASTA